MSDKTELWENLRRVNPSFVKRVKIGSREFHSIDATYKIGLLTKVLGPIGEGWGYRCRRRTLKVDEEILAIVDVLAWRRVSGDRVYWGPVTGCAKILGVKKDSGRIVGKYLDTDAFKKALTDALTKAFSHLGLGADVFMGKYDDDKYVQAEMARFDDETKYVARIKVALKSAGTVEKLAKAKETLDQRFADGAISHEAYEDCIRVYRDSMERLGVKDQSAEG